MQDKKGKKRDRINRLFGGSSLVSVEDKRVRSFSGGRDIAY
jgi:hypothetical protein